MSGTARDGVRLAVGTLTRLPVRAPTRVDRASARAAMLAAPVVGAALGALVGVGAQVLVDHSRTGPLVGAALAVGMIAYLTRAIHLDGLADTVDALGSGRPAAEALQIARRSDIGPFGVVAIVCVLLVQVAAAATALAEGRGALVLALALGSGRLGVTLACRRGVPAARPDGLGAAVAGSVGPTALTVVAIGWMLIAGGLARAGTGTPVGAATAIAGVVAALVVAAAVTRAARERLGGITGDVLGAVAEFATTAALVVLVAVGTP